MEKTKKRNGFVSGIGFVLAAAGSAVGLGNIWGFPYKTSAYGGAAFVFVYILCVLFIGAVAMIAEIYIGKRAQANTVSAYKKTNKNLGFIGLIALAVPFIIICYYSVLGGWTFRFAFNSFQPIEAATNANSFGAFIGGGMEPVLYTILFMLISAVIIMAGIKGGIEKASKILMPTLFVILVFVVVYCLCLGEGVSDGLKYYLNPDFSKLGFDGVVKAMGQAFFSLSLGMGAMIAYGSYTGEGIKIGKSTVMICIFDTMVALLAGLAIFPAIGALQPDKLGSAGGVGLLYSVLPAVFAKMGAFGPFISFLFFAMVVIAAITSVISLMEVVAQFVIQKFKVQRKKATLVVCAICFLISIPVTWSVGGGFAGFTVFGFDLLTFFDEITNTVLMPITAFSACLAIGWFVDKKITANPMNTFKTLQEDGLNLGAFGKAFAVMVKYVTPVLILFVEIMGVYSSIKGNPKYWWIVAFALIISGLCAGAYFLFLKKKETGCNADEIDIAIAAELEKDKSEAAAE